MIQINIAEVLEGSLSLSMQVSAVKHIFSQQAPRWMQYIP